MLNGRGGKNAVGRSVVPGGIRASMKPSIAWPPNDGTVAEKRPVLSAVTVISGLVGLFLRKPWIWPLPSGWPFVNEITVPAIIICAGAVFGNGMPRQAN